MYRQTRGFTLVEVLVVIAIIGVLATILLVTTQSSRERASRTACVTNIHQLTQSLQMYAADYDDSYPVISSWYDWQKTHPSLQLCPVVEQRKREIAVVRGIPGYAINSELTGHHPKPDDPEPWLSIKMPITLKEILFPATTVAFCEQIPSQISAFAPDPNIDTVPYPTGIEQGFKRHNGGCNYSFVDGHVKWYQPESVGRAGRNCEGNVPCKGEGNDGTRPTFMLPGEVSNAPAYRGGNP